MSNKHIIRQFSFDVESAGVDDPHAWQEEMIRFCKTQLIPSAETVLDDLVPGNIFFRLDRLEINLEEIEGPDWENLLSLKFKHKIAGLIQQLLSDAGQTRINEHIYEEAFIDFLTIGTLPWWIRTNDFEAGFSVADIQPKRMRDAYARAPQMVQRLFLQFPEPILMKIFEKLCTGEIYTVKKLIDGLLSVSSAVGINKNYLKPVLWQLAFRKNLEGYLSEPMLFDALFQITIPLFWDKVLEIADTGKYDATYFDAANSKAEARPVKRKILSPLNQIYRLLESYGNQPFKPSSEYKDVLKQKIDRSDWVKNWYAKHENQINDLIQYSRIKQAGTKRNKALDPAIEHGPAYDKNKWNDTPAGVSGNEKRNREGDSSPKPNVKKRKTNNLSKIGDPGAMNVEENVPAKQNPDFGAGQTEHIPGHVNESQETNTRSVREYESFFTEGDFLYVEYAGIIILHPFLSTLFKSLNLLKDKQFIDETAQTKAIHLLFFLASGQEQVTEYHLPLCKFLCGYDIFKPIDRFVVLTEAEKQECNKLLETVIEHWTILKNSSIDALREGFFQREGKLWMEDKNWKLKIEQKGVDILLQNLPWGIGLIRLPWSNKILYIDWT